MTDRIPDTRYNRKLEDIGIDPEKDYTHLSEESSFERETGRQTFDFSLEAIEINGIKWNICTINIKPPKIHSVVIADINCHMAQFVAKVPEGEQIAVLIDLSEIPKNELILSLSNIILDNRATEALSLINEINLEKGMGYPNALIYAPVENDAARIVSERISQRILRRKGFQPLQLFHSRETALEVLQDPNNTDRSFISES